MALRPQFSLSLPTIFIFFLHALLLKHLRILIVNLILEPNTHSRPIDSRTSAQKAFSPYPPVKKPFAKQLIQRLAHLKTVPCRQSKELFVSIDCLFDELYLFKNRLDNRFLFFIELSFVHFKEIIAFRIDRDDQGAKVLHPRHPERFRHA